MKPIEHGDVIPASYVRLPSRVTSRERSHIPGQMQPPRLSRLLFPWLGDVFFGLLEGTCAIGSKLP